MNFIFLKISIKTLRKEESIDDIVAVAEEERHEIIEMKGPAPPKVHLVVVACEGKSKSAIDEARNMIKSAVLLSTEKRIKVLFSFYCSKHTKNIFFSSFTNFSCKLL